MALEKGITVEEALIELQKLDPKAVLVTETEFGCGPVRSIRAGVLYRYLAPRREHSGLIFDHRGPVHAKYQQQPAVLLG